MSIQHVIQLRNGTEANPEGLVKPEASMDSMVFLTRQEKRDLEKFMAKLDDPADFTRAIFSLVIVPGGQCMLG